MSNNNSSKNQKKSTGSHSVATRVLCLVLAGVMVIGVAIILLEKIFGLF